MSSELKSQLFGIKDINILVLGLSSRNYTKLKEYFGPKVNFVYYEDIFEVEFDTLRITLSLVVTRSVFRKSTKTWKYVVDFFGGVKSKPKVILVGRHAEDYYTEALDGGVEDAIQIPFADHLTVHVLLRAILGWLKENKS